MRCSLSQPRFKLIDEAWTRGRPERRGEWWESSIRNCANRYDSRPGSNPQVSLIPLPRYDFVSLSTNAPHRLSTGKLLVRIQPFPRAVSSHAATRSARCERGRIQPEEPIVQWVTGGASSSL